MKTILAAILAVAFLASTPVLAADKDDSGKAGSSGKKDKGGKKGDTKKDDSAGKSGGGW
jgi:uncharacterized protein YxeA